MKRILNSDFRKLIGGYHAVSSEKCSLALTYRSIEYIIMMIEWNNQILFKVVRPILGSNFVNNFFLTKSLY